MLETTAYEAWVGAKKASDFSAFLPSLADWINVNREIARYRDPKTLAYDVLLDGYEKGMTSARLDELFNEVREGLVPLIARIRAKGKAPDSSLLSGTYDIADQSALCRQIAIDIGFDTDKGRFGTSKYLFMYYVSN